MLKGAEKVVFVLKKIIAAHGGVVPDEFYRTGRRHRRVDNKGGCEHRPCQGQRTATQAAKSNHPGSKERPRAH